MLHYFSSLETGAYDVAGTVEATLHNICTMYVTLSKENIINNNLANKCISTGLTHSPWSFLVIDKWRIQSHANGNES